MAELKVTPEVRKKGNALFDDGASQAEVARTLGISDSTIRRQFPGRKLNEKQTLERILIAQQERRLKEKEKGQHGIVR